ncbi:MAG: hypothetical protein AAF443_04200 [Chlamydiota bacterium]
MRKSQRIWRGYFDRLFPWVLLRQVDSHLGKSARRNPLNSELSFGKANRAVNPDTKKQKC